MSIVLDRVLAEDIPALWPHLAPLFARACDADIRTIALEQPRPRPDAFRDAMLQASRKDATDAR